MKRITIKQIGQMTDDAQPPALAEGVGRISYAAEIRGEAMKPGFGEMQIDDLEQWPYRAVREPWIVVGSDSGRRRHDVGEQTPRRRENDVGTDPIVTVGRCTETRGQTL